MRLSILIFVLGLLDYGLKAQQTYFNKRYDVSQSWVENGWSIYADSGRILVLLDNFKGPGNTGPLVTTLLQIDFNGIPIDTDVYSEPYKNIYAGGPGSLSKTNKGYVFGGSQEDSLQGDAMIININNNGDTIWKRTFGDTVFQSGWMAKQMNDGCFYLCGQSATYDTLGDVQFIKTDSSGNLIWQKYYGNNLNSELAFGFTKTLDGGFVLAGENRLPSPYANIYIIKIDSIGDLQWNINYGDQ